MHLRVGVDHRIFHTRVGIWRNVRLVGQPINVYRRINVANKKNRRDGPRGMTWTRAKLKTEKLMKNEKFMKEHFVSENISINSSFKMYIRQ